ncbi:MAG: hypothetical protein V2B14_04615 [bacterium]
MPIEKFDPKEFAKNLVQQAAEMIPKDLSENQRNFIIGKINHLCIEAGDYINKTPNIKLNANQASTVIQFIAKWTFHKSIDLIRLEISHEHWDFVLNKVACVAFHTAKEAIINGMDDNSIINQVEKEVKASFEKSLKELVKIDQEKKTLSFLYNIIVILIIFLILGFILIFCNQSVMQKIIFWKNYG